MIRYVSFCAADSLFRSKRQSQNRPARGLEKSSFSRLFLLQSSGSGPDHDPFCVVTRFFYGPAEADKLAIRMEGLEGL